MKRIALKTNQLILAVLLFTPCPKNHAATWKDWFVGIGAATGISAGLYWLLKPVSTETLKRDAEKCYTENKSAYASLLESQNNTKKLLAQARAIGQTKYRGFWRSLFTSEDNHLGHDAQHRSPLLRGTACLVDDANQIAKNKQKLDDRFGSSDAAKREFHNYGNMLALQARLLATAKKIKETRDYATAQEQFAQYREQKKLAEAAQARLDRIEHKLDAQKRETNASIFIFNQRSTPVQPYSAPEGASNGRPRVAPMPIQQRPPAFAPYSAPAGATNGRPHAPIYPTVQPSAPELPEEA